MYYTLATCNVCPVGSQKSLQKQTLQATYSLAWHTFLWLIAPVMGDMEPFAGGGGGVTDWGDKTYTYSQISITQTFKGNW